MAEPLIDLKALLVEHEDCDAGTVTKLRNGLAEMDKRLPELTGGLGQGADGVRKMDDGVAQLRQGVGAARGGLAQLRKGLADGQKALMLRRKNDAIGAFQMALDEDPDNVTAAAGLRQANRMR